MAWGDDAPILKRAAAPAAKKPGGFGDDAPVVAPGKSRTKGNLGDRISLGFDEGFAKPIDNLATWADRGLKALGLPMDAISRVTDGGTTDEVNARHQADFRHREEAVTPSPVGKMVGNIAGTVPVVLATKNPYLAGAGQGALLTDHPDDLGAVAGDAALGAVLNKAGGVVMDKIADVAQPVIQPAVAALKKAGVRLTPGQVRGGRAMAAEDRRMSQPFVGDAIAADRRAGVEDFNRGAVNRALFPLGVRLPDNIQTGHDAIAFAQDAAGKAYDSIMPKLSLQADPRIAVGLRNGWRVAQDLPDDLRARFLETVKNKLRFDPDGQMAGRSLASGIRSLKKLATDFAKSADPDQRILGEALGHVDDGVQSALRAQNPGYGKALDAANAAYKGTMIVSGAAKGADEGIFGTNQLKAAVRQADRTKNQRATAAGRAYMQDLADAGRQVLPATVPDSGTAGRVAADKLIPAVRGAVNRAGYQADKAYTDFLLAPRPAWAGKLADFLRRQKGLSGLLAASGVPSLISPDQ